MTSQDCTICLELTSNGQYLTRCCGACLCKECYSLLVPPNNQLVPPNNQLVPPNNQLINQSTASTNLTIPDLDSSTPTCDRCGFSIDPIDATAAVSNLIVEATTAATTKITADLDSIEATIESIRATLTQVADNTAELKRELVANNVGAGQVQLLKPQLASLTEQLATFSSSMTKNYQLKLDELLAWRELLCCRLQTLSRGVIADQVSLLALTKFWSPFKLTGKPQKYQRRVWWRHYSSTTWHLVKVGDFGHDQNHHQNHHKNLIATKQAIPAVRYFVTQTGTFLARLLDERLALVSVTNKQAQMLVEITALDKQDQTWMPGSDVDVTLKVPNPHWHRPSSYGLGLTLGQGQLNQRQGYYFYYCIDKTSKISGRGVALIVHDFLPREDGTTSRDQSTHVKSYEIQLSTRVTGQVYRYGNILFTIVASRFTVIQLGKKTEHTVLTSPQQDLHICRIDQDQLFLNWNNKEIWSYSLESLVDGLDLINGGLVPPPLRKIPYRGPIYNTYFELVAPGQIVYYNYAAEDITTMVKSIHGSKFTSVDISNDGVVCIV